MLEAVRAVRNVQLAAEGAWSLLFKASVKTLNRLVEAGQAWEDGLMEPAPATDRDARMVGEAASGRAPAGRSVTRGRGQ